MENELKIFKNEEFGQVRVINIDNEGWMVGKDITTVLGYQNPSKALNDHVDEEDKLNKLNLSQLGQRGGILINKDGLYSLIASSRTATCAFKDRFIEWLKCINIINTSLIVIKSRKEIEFIGMLENTLKPFNYECIRQYPVLNYFLDLYIKDLNVAIEYDENNHSSYTYQQQEGRQKEIEKELGCRFIRISDNKSNGENVGIVFKNLIKNTVA